jgi:hypothetical protein
MKDTVKEMGRQAVPWKKIFTKEIFHKGWLSKINPL